MARYLQSNINVLLCYYCYSWYKVVMYHGAGVNLELSERGAKFGTGSATPRSLAIAIGLSFVWTSKILFYLRAF